MVGVPGYHLPSLDSISRIASLADSTPTMEILLHFLISYERGWSSVAMHPALRAVESKSSCSRSAALRGVACDSV